ncbi:MAG: hypothetical protein VYA84_06385 [Planctomycetota bacterium]|nr:hypothetical protein [Planctomycetota bacterium]
MNLPLTFDSDIYRLQCNQIRLSLIEQIGQAFDIVLAVSSLAVVDVVAKNTQSIVFSGLAEAQG